MNVLQNLGKNVTRMAVNNQQCRSFIVSKPRVRVSFAEKVMHGIVLFTVPMAIPLYLCTKFAEWTIASKEK